MKALIYNIVKMRRTIFYQLNHIELKQIIDLQDELNECRARPTLATDERGVVKVEYR